MAADTDLIQTRLHSVLCLSPSFIHLSLHFRLTSIQIYQRFFFLPLLSLSFSRQKNLIGQCRRMSDLGNWIQKRSSTFLLSRILYIREKEKYLCLNWMLIHWTNVGGEGIRYSLETGEGEYSSEIKKIPKAKSRFRLKFLNERIEESLEPVWIHDLIGSRNFCETSSGCKSRTPFHSEFPPLPPDILRRSSYFFILCTPVHVRLRKLETDYSENFSGSASRCFTIDLKISKG